MLLRSLVLSALALTLSACNLSGTGENGPFKTADELAQVKGVGDSTVDKNRDNIVVE